MAQRLYQQFQKTLAPDVVSVFAKFTILSGGVASVTVKDNIGIKSIGRVASNHYRITMGSIREKTSPDLYNKILSVSTTPFLSGNFAYRTAHVLDNNISTTGAFDVFFSSSTAPSMPVGTTITLEIKLKNSKR